MLCLELVAGFSCEVNFLKGQLTAFITTSLQESRNQKKIGFAPIYLDLRLHHEETALHQVFTARH